MTPRIVVVGSLNMDLVVKAPRHPRPGETLTGGPLQTLPGGKGANQALAAARMGGHVSMIGSVGNDSFGDALIENLRSGGVDVRNIRRANTSTGVALITVSESGENTIVIVPGANATVDTASVSAHEELIAAADALLLQLEVPLPTVRRAAMLARKHGVPVLLNPAPAQPLPADLLRLVNYLIPNEHEAALLTDATARESVATAQAAEKLRSQGIEHVIVTRGSQGALVLSESDLVEVKSFPVTVVDSTAAGDAFVGTFAVAMSEGWSTVEAALWGCAAGALACTVFGAQPSLPERSAVAELVATRQG